MSYKYETQYDSPNFTAAANVSATWGRPRSVDAIAIHWWGDPNTNPSYEGVISTLCNPSRGASAHFVATGTGRRAAQLVNLNDASWATNQANPWTISIECDPRGRNEDYDVVAEVISQIWDAYGYKPLVPHNQFVATACPGNYDLARLEKLVKTKDGSGAWGTVKNKPVITTKDVVVSETIPYQKQTVQTDELLVGESKISVAGVNGAKDFTYTVTYTDGKETKRSLKSTAIAKNAITEVTLVGTKVPAEPIEPEKPVVEPTDNWLTKLIKAIIEVLKSLIAK